MESWSKWWIKFSQIILLLLYLHVTVACPTECSCTRLPGNKLLSSIFLNSMSPDQSKLEFENVVCSKQNLKKLPENIPSGVVRLDLSYNKLKGLDKQDYNLDTIKSLDLSHNEIKTLDSDVFSNNLSLLQDLVIKNNSISVIQPNTFHNISNLTSLDLAGNSISELDETIFNGLHILQLLNLSQNNISAIRNQSFLEMRKLEILDLSGNSLHQLESNMFLGLMKLKILNLSHNSIKYISMKTFQLLRELEKLDLSYNSFQSTSDFMFSGLNALHTLNLSHNLLTILSERTFNNVSSLKVLRLDSNPLSAINIPVFSQLQNLSSMSLSQMPYLSDLSFNIFAGLDNLLSLNLSLNPHLSFINPHLLSVLPRLHTIDLHSNNISYLSALTFLDNPNISYIDLSHNALKCSCDIKWLTIYVNDSINCEHNGDLIPLSKVTNDTFPCAKPILNINEINTFYHKLGSDAHLTCGVLLDPSMIVIWTTPRNKVLTYHAFHPDATKHLPDPDYINETREWVNSTSYHSEFIYRKERVLLLSDSSLYIDYVLRSDTGEYKCEVRNAYHNVSNGMYIWLDFGVLFDVKIWSLIVGFCCSASFFVLIVIYTLVRWSTIRIVNQRRRDAIRKLLEDLDAYKHNQLTKIRDQYSSQLARVSDNYHSQLERLRGNYSMQMGRVKRGCSHQVDRIRDNYNTQVGRLKDYSSHQIDQLRTGYNNQLLKIRDFGSLQFDRLRETCKLGQMNVMKLMETMNMDNCKGIVDTECLRAESMIFPPVDIQDLSLIGSESDYTTASDDTDDSKSNGSQTPEGDLGLPSSLESDREKPFTYVDSDSSDDVRPPPVTIELDLGDISVETVI